MPAPEPARDDIQRDNTGRDATLRRGGGPARPARLFSTPLESGLRTLFLLAALSAPTDLQRLVVLDYLLVHSGDAGGPESLHPATPHRSGEILVKRDLVHAGLRLIISRDLAVVECDAAGVRYRASDLTGAFLAYFEGDYVSRLRDRAAWVASAFGGLDDGALRVYVAEHLAQWGGEFTTEAAVRDVAL